LRAEIEAIEKKLTSEDAAWRGEKKRLKAALARARVKRREKIRPVSPGGFGNFFSGCPVPGLVVFGALPSSTLPSFRRSRPSCALRSLCSVQQHWQNSNTAQEIGGLGRLMRWIGSMIVKATMRGAAVRYGIDPEEYYREPRSGGTSVTRAQAERWRY
jgi:hypothetical protein